MKEYGFGVDVGGTTCKIGLFEMTGALLEKWEIKTDTSDGGNKIIANIAKAVEQKRVQRELKPEEIAGIGLGVPGPVAADGTVLQCVNLGWEHYKAAEILADMTGLDVKIGNDANVAALGELWQGGGRGYQDMVMVTLGTGVGGAVILQGKIIAGAHGIGGEIGHMTMSLQEEEPCACGKHGCLEQYASATGLVRVTKKLLAEGEPSVLEKETELSAKGIFEAAENKDTVAQKAVEQLGLMLGTALANVSSVVNPEIFVIGGGVSKAGEPLLAVVKKNFMEQILPAGRATQFAIAMLGNDAGIYGGVRMLLG